VNELYLGICLEEGYEFVRGNPKNWYWQETQHESWSKKWFRSADCFFEMGGKTSYSIDEIQIFGKEPIILPASRILRPHSAGNPLFNQVRLRRILNEMEFAAKNREVYHLWWHPHNFGHSPEASLEELVRIVDQFGELKSRYGMQSMHMESLGLLVKNTSIPVAV
jgi:hypothetical protein